MLEHIEIWTLLSDGNNSAVDNAKHSVLHTMYIVGIQCVFNPGLCVSGCNLGGVDCDKTY